MSKETVPVSTLDNATVLELTKSTDPWTRFVAEQELHRRSHRIGYLANVLFPNHLGGKKK